MMVVDHKLGSRLGPRSRKGPGGKGDSCAETGTEMSESTMVMVREGGLLLACISCFDPVRLLDTAAGLKCSYVLQHV